MLVANDGCTRHQILETLFETNWSAHPLATPESVFSPCKSPRARGS